MLKLNPSLHRLPVYRPGKTIQAVAREHGFSPADIAKLASNENPLGPSPTAIQAIQNTAPTINLYPDGNASALKYRLSQTLNLSPSNILCYNFRFGSYFATAGTLGTPNSGGLRLVVSSTPRALVPEPKGYALVFGLFALGFVILLRHWQKKLQSVTIFATRDCCLQPTIGFLISLLSFFMKAKVFCFLKNDKFKIRAVGTRVKRIVGYQTTP